MNVSAPATQLLRIPGDFFGSFRRVLAEQRSAVEAATLLRQAGFETGAAFQAAFESWLDGERGASSASLSAEEFWEAFAGFWSDLGWGRLDHQGLHAGVAALDGTEWAEATAAGDLGHPACHFTTGVLSELLSRVAGGEVAVMEVECAAAGDDRCRFLFGGESALASVYAGMTEGLSYREGLERLG